ncbi:diacylglycerol kinase [Novosphingobium sp. 1949]|uniref:Diacylglycerol kinase n=1 Tax=Novosphingobium organovorum TaxID=2930092 RepID=A0ABT0BCX1_9SPHN|nr:diacylglycerol kinase family protein [Novosphingobium organovorum]MCJ2182730.1 diacylglycerol kinase [Novosphingobium organovorum]
MKSVHGNIYEFTALPKAKRNRDGSQPRVARPWRPAPAVPLVGIIRNPRAHRNANVAPEMADCSNILTESPKSRADLSRTLAGFAHRGIDYLVIDGGDGTVRDVLTCGAPVFGEDWPRLIILPKGKTNALTVDLGLPGKWTLSEALAAAHKGKTATRHPLRITECDAAGEPVSASVQGFILGTGAYALCTEAGQEAHRRGAFNGLAVGLSILWGVLQSLFGRAGNIWRAGTPTRLIDRLTGRTLTHSGPGNPDERFLAIATTFERFPIGARPFGRKVAPGLKMIVLDQPNRLVLGMIPAIMFGFAARFLEKRGLHRFATSDVEMDIAGNFILDGESFPAGRYIMDEGPLLTFVIP